MIVAPNSLNLNCKVRVMKEAPGPSVSEEIADIFTNHNIDASSEKFSTLVLTHWGRVMHICVGNLTIIGSDNGLAPAGRQAIIWTNDG